METKFTKGEWKRTETGIMSKDGLLISQCWYGNKSDSFGNLDAVPSHQEYVGNSKLIAAAPELLEVLCDLVNEFDFQNEKGFHNPLIEKAREAINKATK